MPTQPRKNPCEGLWSEAVNRVIYYPSSMTPTITSQETRTSSQEYVWPLLVQISEQNLGKLENKLNKTE